MKVKDNLVYTAAMRFAGNFHEVTPEAVIFGYSKLLSMDEKQIANLVSEENMYDLEAASRWFMDNQLDIKLIKSGLLMLIPLIKHDDEQSRKYEDFSSFLEEEESGDESIGILSYALEKSVIPFSEVFCSGKDIIDVFTYHETLKRLKTDEPVSCRAEDSEKGGAAPEKETLAEEKAEKKQETNNDNTSDLYALSEKYRKLESG